VSIDTIIFNRRTTMRTVLVLLAVSTFVTANGALAAPQGDNANNRQVAARPVATAQPTLPATPPAATTASTFVPTAGPKETQQSGGINSALRR
jgi:hypothetical protein